MDAAHPRETNWSDADSDELNRLWKAMMLAPTAEVLDALLKGEKVPLSDLDPVWVRKLS